MVVTNQSENCVCIRIFVNDREKVYVCVGACLHDSIHVCALPRHFFQLTKYLPIVPLHLLVSCFLVTGNYVYSPRSSPNFLIPKSVSSIFNDLFSKFICFVLCSTKFNSDHLCDHGLGTIHYTLIGSPMGTHWTLALLFSK